ncbi:MAG: hypothetical protein AAF388_29000 [Bacteroidota bacterium]
MASVVFSGESETDLKLLIALAQKMGIKAHILDEESWEDVGMGLAIEEGKIGYQVDTESFLKELEKTSISSSPRLIMGE